MHKDGHPLRMMIVINSLFFNLAICLKDDIDKSIKKNFSYIKNSFDLVKKINCMLLEEDY